MDPTNNDNDSEPCIATEMVEEISMPVINHTPAFDVEESGDNDIPLESDNPSTDDDENELGPNQTETELMEGSTMTETAMTKDTPSKAEVVPIVEEIEDPCMARSEQTTSEPLSGDTVESTSEETALNASSADDNEETPQKYLVDDAAKNTAEEKTSTTGYCDDPEAVEKVGDRDNDIQPTLLVASMSGSTEQEDNDITTENQVNSSMAHSDDAGNQDRGVAKDDPDNANDVTVMTISGESTDELEADISIPDSEIPANINAGRNLPWWYPRICGKPVFYGTKEALGWACNAVAQASVLIGTGAFILPAIQTLAKEEAGCETEALPGEDLAECDGRIYGIKPSSLLTVMSTVVGLISAIVIPPVGAVVDFTSHRRLVGKWLSVFYSLLILTLAFLDEDSWFGLSFCFLAAISIGWAQTMLFNAYLPELTDDEDRLNEFSKTFTVLIFTTMVVYLAVVMGIGIAGGFADDDVALARCAAIVAFVLSAILFYAAWWLLFEERPASHVLPVGQSLWGAGFRQVHRTSKRIWNDYHALKWFYISICFGDAAIQSLSVIAITFITDLLQFSSQEVGAAALLLLLGSIPGAVFGAMTNKTLNPIKSSEFAVCGMLIGTAMAAIVLKRPGQQLFTYGFAFLWGFGTGWKYTADRVLAAGIIPGGQDTELMGFYTFCGQIFAWVPSLLFTILNEAGVSQRIGLATLTVVFLGALMSYGMMGDYATAISTADRLRVDSIPSVAKQQQQQQWQQQSVIAPDEEVQYHDSIPDENTDAEDPAKILSKEDLEEYCRGEGWDYFELEKRHNSSTHSTHHSA